MSTQAPARPYFTVPVFPRHSYRKRRKSDSSSSSRSPSPSSSRGSRNVSPSAPLQPLPTTSEPRTAAREAQILREHNLNPPPSTAPYLRQTHLSVLTTLLHRCILTADWPRARRAFGLLIRGKDVELRKIWGIGVDILLRMGQDEEEGWEKAIEFIDRLVLFYPYRSTLHAQHPALRGGREARQREAAAELERGKEAAGKIRRRRKKKGDGESEGARKDEEKKPPHISAVDMMPELFNCLVKASRYVDAERAPRDRREGLLETRPEKVKERLEQLMLTPPWSDMEHLMLVRGMVCLWIADLDKEEQERVERGDWGDEGEPDERTAKMEAEVRKGRIRQMTVEAKEWFQKIQALQGNLPGSIQDWLENGAPGEDMDLDDTMHRNNWDSD